MAKTWKNRDTGLPCAIYLLYYRGRGPYLNLPTFSPFYIMYFISSIEWAPEQRCKYFPTQSLLKCLCLWVTLLYFREVKTIVATAPCTDSDLQACFCRFALDSNPCRPRAVHYKRLLYGPRLETRRKIQHRQAMARNEEKVLLAVPVWREMPFTSRSQQIAA